jgi:Arc/MetJ-type ribon-helix-helix transcriptional regulator
MRWKGFEQSQPMEKYPVRAEKLPISLTPEAITLIDRYRATYAIKSRSQVIEHALRKLRDEELESAYREAAITDAADWDATLSDGLSDETW